MKSENHVTTLPMLISALIIVPAILQRAKDPILNWAPLQVGKMKCCAAIGRNDDQGQVSIEATSILTQGDDVAAHYGKIERDDTLGRIDSWRNILSNKVSALYRVEAKDVIDLWALSRMKSFNWAEILREACSKEAGIDPVILYDLLMSFPREELSAIKWVGVKPIELNILRDLKVMAVEIFEGSDNSLNVNKSK